MSNNDYFDEDYEDYDDYDDYDDDYCYECTGYGYDYFENEDGELECYCPQCPHNPNSDYWDN